ncbi:MAG: hypothetical protein HZA78_03025 [Candidatus Schekmanbacteria bacterium]|nr:hypothetical protein [Candidatus Schekmanbacteria bacterium]
MYSRFVTTQKFSEITGLPVKTVRIALSDGRLEGAPFGKRHMIDVTSYENKLLQRKFKIKQEALNFFK